MKELTAVVKPLDKIGCIIAGIDDLLESAAEMMQLIQQIDRLVKIPVIFCTKCTDKKAICEASKQGLSDFILKPVNPKILLVKIQKALQKGKRGVLIVEDEVIVRARLKNLVELKGYAVYTAETAGDGHEILKKTDISLLITDIGLPDMTGSAFTLEIKAKYPDMPVLMVTGLSTKQANIARACGVDGQILIPSTNTDIADMLNYCMRKNRRAKVK